LSDDSSVAKPKITLHCLNLYRRTEFCGDELFMHYSPSLLAYS